MSKRWKRIISVLLAVCATISLCLSSYASPGKNEPNKSGSQYTTYSLQDMRTIAMNALLSDFIMEAYNGTWDGVEIVKETPLHDTEGNLTSYCFDLRCEQQNSYMIVSATSKNYPVMQFAAHASSQYLDADSSTESVYVGPGQYLAKSDTDDSFVDLSTGQVIEVDGTEAVTAHLDEATEDFNDIAQLYISGDILNQPMPIAEEVTYKRLTGVPEYDWYLGCVPTAMAMILAYHYSGFTEKSLIKELAENMGTDTCDGNTKYNKVADGTKAVLSNHNKFYTSIGFASTWSPTGTILYGGLHNTFDAYRDEILANRPVFIAMAGAKGVSPYFKDGFGDHALTGVGYNCQRTTTYVIVHTTILTDHAVSVPLDSTNLGSYAWCFVVP